MLEHYYRELLSFLARRLPDRATAADLTQESYARVYEAQRGGSVVRDPRALLYRIARNLLADHHRRAAVRTGGETAQEDDAVVDPDRLAGPPGCEPEAQAASRQGVAAMVAAIDALPPRCREAFVLYKFDGLSYAEVAERMGISVRTVEMQLRIAMRACWACLDAQQADGADTADGAPPP